MRWKDGHCVRTDVSQQLSGMCGSKKLLLNFFKTRLVKIETKGFDRHYEPQDKDVRENYQSEIPNIDIRHDGNVSISKWSVNDFRNKENAKGWQEANEVPGWNIKQIFI